jgi:hypothetical protein
METSTHRPQRTGWVILVLMVATNFLAWMEPLVAVTTGMEELGSMHLRMSLGACLLAATLVTATWLTGRHSSSPLPRALYPPRLLGFRISLVIAAVNIAFGLAMALLGDGASVGPVRLALAIQGAWFLFVLPAEVMASYLTGRGTTRQPSAPPLAA